MIPTDNNKDLLSPQETQENNVVAPQEVTPTQNVSTATTEELKKEVSPVAPKQDKKPSYQAQANSTSKDTFFQYSPLDMSGYYNSEKRKEREGRKARTLDFLNNNKNATFYEAFTRSLVDPEKEKEKRDKYQRQRNYYKGLMVLGEALNNSINASGKNAYTIARTPDRTFDQETQRELARMDRDYQQARDRVLQSKQMDKQRADNLAQAELNRIEREDQNDWNRTLQIQRANREGVRLNQANKRWKAEYDQRDKIHKDAVALRKAYGYGGYRSGRDKSTTMYTAGRVSKVIDDKGKTRYSGEGSFSFSFKDKDDQKNAERDFIQRYMESYPEMIEAFAKRRPEGKWIDRYKKRDEVGAINALTRNEREELLGEAIRHGDVILPYLRANNKDKYVERLYNDVANLSSEELWDLSETYAKACGVSRQVICSNMVNTLKGRDLEKRNELQTFFNSCFNNKGNALVRKRSLPSF